MRGEIEAVWIVVDAVGQPCLRYITHRPRGGRSPPKIPEGLRHDDGPHTVRAYVLVPAESWDYATTMARLADKGAS